MDYARDMMQIMYKGVMMPASEVMRLKELEAKGGVQLTQSEAISAVVNKEVPKLTPDTILDDVVVSDIEPKGEDIEQELQVLRLQYKEKYGSEVTNRYKNDKERLTEKVNQVISE